MTPEQLSKLNRLRADEIERLRGVLKQIETVCADNARPASRPDLALAFVRQLIAKDEGAEDWSCAADFLDDIEVDANGMCRWGDVANAQTHIRASLRSIKRTSIPVCARCGAKVHDPCASDQEQTKCELPDFCFPNGRTLSFSSQERQSQ